MIYFMELNSDMVIFHTVNSTTLKSYRSVIARHRAQTNSAHSSICLCNHFYNGFFVIVCGRVYLSGTYYK